MQRLLASEDMGPESFLPFGLTKAPQLLRSLDEQKVLNEYLDQFVVVYLDDIVVFSPSLEEDQVHLRLVKPT